MDKKEIQNLIKELVEKTTVLVDEISISEDNSISSDTNQGMKVIYFGVEIKEPHFFLDHEGEGLFALNHLIRKIIENKLPKTDTINNLSLPRVRGWESGPQIMIDVNGFQKKRIESLHAVAHMMAERARYFKSNIEVDPMSAFERRIVHEFLSNATDLKTESIGFGPSRRVVIKYIGGI